MCIKPCRDQAGKVGGIYKSLKTRGISRSDVITEHLLERLAHPVTSSIIAPCYDIIIQGKPAH